MRFATDFLRSKTTWSAAGALCYVLADVAAKGELTWQSALIALVATLGATIRDTLAKSSEEGRLDVELFEAALKTTAETARLGSRLLMMATPKSETPTPRRNVAGEVWPPQPIFGGQMSNQTEVKTGAEADRPTEEAP